MQRVEPTLQLFAHEFVESAGAILFDKDMKRICLLYNREKGVYILPKGRRNCNESRPDAAVREVREETGYHCEILPLKMKTRAPPENECGQTSDSPREEDALQDPFALTIRDQGNRRRKLVWWYIARWTGDEETEYEFDRFKRHWILCEEAMEMLTYKADSELAQRAIQLVGDKPSY